MEFGDKHFGLLWQHEISPWLSHVEKPRDDFPYANLPCSLEAHLHGDRSPFSFIFHMEEIHESWGRKHFLFPDLVARATTREGVAAAATIAIAPGGSWSAHRSSRASLSGWQARISRFQWCISRESRPCHCRRKIHVSEQHLHRSLVLLAQQNLIDLAILGPSSYRILLHTPASTNGET